MYIHNTTPRAALCIICLLFCMPWRAAGTACYNIMDNDSGFTTVESTAFYDPYACQLAAANIAYDSSTHTHTFNIATTAGTTTCGEMMSSAVVSFGYYECQMQPPGIAGTVTSCMVISTVSTHYESVYIKFIGNDTARVYIGFFYAGQGYQAGPATLGFDATLQPHRYAFEWTSGYIKWYVDDKEVSSALGNQPIPTTPNYFVADLVTEEPGFISDNSYLPTDNTVNRVYVDNGTVSTNFQNISFTPVISISCDNSSGIIPSGGGGAYNPNACDLRLPFTIFGDSLATGWNNTDSTTSNFAYTGNVFTGTYAISWDVIPNARLYLLAPATFPSTTYYEIEFWIYGNGYNGQQIGAQMLFDDGTPSVSVNLATVLSGGIQPYEWARISIPFYLFGNSPNVTRNVKGFVLSSLSNVFGGRISIDEVLLGHEYPMCANSSVTIYSNGLASGYSDYSWGTWTLLDTDTSYTGSYSVMWELYGSSGIRFHSSNGVDSTVYTGISFWINTAQLAGWQWTFAMTNDYSTAANQQIGAAIPLFEYYGGSLPQQDGQWSHIVIPFYEMGIESGSLNGIVFQLQTSDYQGILYIDDIQYIHEQSPQSGAAKTSVSTALLIVSLVLYNLL